MFIETPPKKCPNVGRFDLFLFIFFGGGGDTLNDDVENNDIVEFVTIKER